MINSQILTFITVAKKQISFFAHNDPKMIEWFAQMVEERKHNNDHRKEKLVNTY